MKECPKCNINHNKPGKFCSRKCSNSRVWSETDKQIKSEGMKRYYKSEEGQERKLIPITRSEHSLETKEKISNSVKKSWTPEMRKRASERCSNRVILDSTRKKYSILAKNRNFGGHTSKQKLLFKKKDGTVVYLQSSYEIAFASILEELDIEWSRPEPIIWVDDNNKEHRYYPDFKIGNIFIDTKNDYLAIKDLPKINAVRIQNNIDVRIVTKNLITKEYINSLVID